MIKIYQTASDWEQRNHLRFDPTAQIDSKEALDVLKEMLKQGWEVFSIEMWGSRNHAVGVRRVEKNGIGWWQRFWGSPEEMRPLFAVAREWRAAHLRPMN